MEPVAPDTTGEQPIFVVGLPRTGTMLVERILGNHSQVHSTGELQALSEAIGAVVDRKSPALAEGWLGYASALGDLDGAWIAGEYLARSRRGAARRGDKARFSDKQTANFFYCALILRAFPNARIVHLTRQPLAACYAIYKTRFYGTLVSCTRSRSRSVSYGFHTSKIKIARGTSESFHASCSIVSSKTQAVPTCHSRVTPPTLNPQPGGTINGRCTVTRVLVTPVWDGIRVCASKIEKKAVGPRPGMSIRGICASTAAVRRAAGSGQRATFGSSIRP